MSDSAHRILLLAKEGLDMVSQVSGIVDGTIVSAEAWCERLGRRRPLDDAREGPAGLPVTEPREDVEMTDDVVAQQPKY